LTLSFVVRKYQEQDKEQCRGLWRELTEWHREIYQDPNIGEHPQALESYVHPTIREKSHLNGCCVQSLTL